MINPVPYVVFDGVEIQAKVAGGAADWAALAVAGLSVSWGRPSLLDHAGPGSATVRLLAKPRYQAIVAKPTGAAVRVGIRWPGNDLTIFRGRVDSAELDWFHTVDGDPVFDVQLTCTGDLAELERTVLIPGGSFGRHSADTRRGLIAYHLRHLTWLKGIGGLGNFPWSVAQREYTNDVGGRAAVEELFQTAGEYITWDPHTQRIEAAGRYWWEGAGPFLRLVRDGAGRVRVAPFAGGEGSLDGGQVAMAPAQFDQLQTIDRVDADGWLRHGDDTWEAQPRVTRWTADDGRRGMPVQVSTLGFVDISTDVSLGRAAAENLALVEDAKKFTHPPIAQRHPAGWAHESDMLAHLACTERRRAEYVMGSVYNTIPATLPLFRPIGGTVTYDRPHDDAPMSWHTTSIMAPVPAEGTRKPITLAQLNPSGTTAAKSFSYAELHDSLTLADLGHTEQGL